VWESNLQVEKSPEDFKSFQLGSRDELKALRFGSHGAFWLPSGIIWADCQM
jgi:hypothetical protein